MVFGRADVEYRIGARDETRAGIDSAQRNIDNLSRSASTAFGGMGARATAAGVAVGLLADRALREVGQAAGAAARETVGFDTSLHEINTVIRVSDADLGKLGQEALDTSAKLGVMPHEVLPALYTALSSGIPQQNAIGFVEAAAKSAIGGVTTLEVATDGLSSVVNAWAKDNLSAADAADSLFTGVRLGKVRFEELATDIGHVAPIAAGLNVSLDEVTAGIAFMTNRGFAASEAVTSIRAALIALIRPTDNMTEVFNHYGFANGQAAIEALGFKGALDLVRDAVGNDVGALVKLTQRVEGANAILTLTGENGDAFNQMLGEMANKTGSAQLAFDEMNKSTARMWETLQSQVAVILVTLGNELLPELNARLADTTQWVRDNQDGIGNAFRDATSAVGETIDAIAQLVSSSPVKFVIDVVTNLSGDTGKLLALIAAVGGGFKLGGPVGAAAGFGAYEGAQQKTNPTVDPFETFQETFRAAPGVGGLKRPVITYLPDLLDKFGLGGETAEQRRLRNELHAQSEPPLPLNASGQPDYHRPLKNLPEGMTGDADRGVGGAADWVPTWTPEGKLIQPPAPAASSKPVPPGWFHPGDDAKAKESAKTAAESLSEVFLTELAGALAGGLSPTAIEGIVAEHEAIRAQIAETTDRIQQALGVDFETAAKLATDAVLDIRAAAESIQGRFNRKLAEEFIKDAGGGRAGVDALAAEQHEIRQRIDDTASELAEILGIKLPDAIKLAADVILAQQEKLKQDSRKNASILDTMTLYSAAGGRAPHALSAGQLGTKSTATVPGTEITWRDANAKQGIATFASGGTMRDGGLAWVGEQGPELVRLPPNTEVLNASRSRAYEGKVPHYAGGTPEWTSDEEAMGASRGGRPAYDDWRVDVTGVEDRRDWNIGPTDRQSISIAAGLQEVDRPQVRAPYVPRREDLDYVIDFNRNERALERDRVFRGLPPRHYASGTVQWSDEWESMAAGRGADYTPPPAESVPPTPAGNIDPTANYTRGALSALHPYDLGMVPARVIASLGINRPGAGDETNAPRLGGQRTPDVEETAVSPFRRAEQARYEQLHETYAQPARAHYNDGLFDRIAEWLGSTRAENRATTREQLGQLRTPEVQAAMMDAGLAGTGLTSHTMAAVGRLPRALRAFAADERAALELGGAQRSINYVSRWSDDGFMVEARIPQPDRSFTKASGEVVTFETPYLTAAARGRIREGMASISDLHADEALKRQGIATDLMRELVQQAQERGLGVTTSGVFSPAGRGFFSALADRGLAQRTPDNFILGRPPGHDGNLLDLLPHYQQGTPRIPGRRGEEVLTVMHAGEGVINAPRAGAMANDSALAADVRGAPAASSSGGAAATTTYNDHRRVDLTIQVKPDEYRETIEATQVGLARSPFGSRFAGDE